MIKSLLILPEEEFLLSCELSVRKILVVTYLDLEEFTYAVCGLIIILFVYA